MENAVLLVISCVSLESCRVAHQNIRIGAGINFLALVGEVIAGTTVSKRSVCMYLYFW